MRPLFRRLILIHLTALSACGGAEQRTVDPAHAQDTAPVGRSEPPGDPCGEREGLVIEPIDPIVAIQQGGSTLAGTGQAVVRWCGAGTVVMESLRVATTTYRRDPVGLGHGDAITFEIHGASQPSMLDVLAIANDEQGSEYQARTVLQTLEDPEVVERRTTCEAAGGTWAGHGMLGIPSCDRPTADAGQRCLSDADCQGPCIADRVEVLSGPPPDGVDAPTCSDGQELKIHVGQCYERSLRFGCHPRLPHVTLECVNPGMAVRRRMVCVD